MQDTAAIGELPAPLDACPPGQLAPMQRAERDVARAGSPPSTGTRRTRLIALTGLAAG